MISKIDVQNFIKSNRDDKNAEFERKLIFTKYDIYGLKTNVLESYAKKLLNEQVDFKNFLPPQSYEEIVIYGILIGKCKQNAKEKVEMLKLLLPYIDNWGSCDTILSRLKNMESESEFFFSLLSNVNPFYQRFGIVWILKYYLKIDIKKSLFLIKTTKNDDFYLKMGKSWAYAEAFIYDFDLTLKTLLNDEDDFFIIKKSIQKALESYRITSEQKGLLRKVRENLGK